MHIYTFLFGPNWLLSLIEHGLENVFVSFLSVYRREY